jgi:hypothetical protein
MKIKIALLAITAGLALIAPPAFADTIREFQGHGPGEIRKNAYNAGYKYPSGEVICKSNGYCYQKWGKPD